MLMSDGERWLAEKVQQTLDEELSGWFIDPPVDTKRLAEAVAIELVLSRVRLP